MNNISVTSKKVNVLPLVKYYMQELELPSIFKEHVPCAAQAKVEPSEMLCILIANIIIDVKPLYQVENWVSTYADGLAEDIEQANLYNDDRLGWGLDKLFGADRNTMLAHLTANAMKLHELETDVMHNDTTSVTFQGNYENESSEAKKLRRGHNKDFRPDCKQLVFGLTTTDDGHVPLHYKLFNGNQSDDKTHIPIWRELKKFISREDFIYIADCKLCSIENINYIAEHGGKFITVMPRNRKEVKVFYEKLETTSLPWEFAYEKPSSRKRDKIVTYKTYTGEKSAEGYPIVWVHSSAKETLDRNRRSQKISKATKALEELNKKLNKRKLKEKTTIESAIKQITQSIQSFFKLSLIENKSTETIKIGRGRPNESSEYTSMEKIEYDLDWTLDNDAIAKSAKTDGVFPLITNTELEAKEVLQHYKEQPYLENRHSNLKSVLEVAPVFLKNDKRIEAIMFLYFVALMIISLIERRIRKSMKEEEIEKLAILPSKMKTKAPTWNNIRYFFDGIHQSIVTIQGNVEHSAVKGVSDLHAQVLKLLHIPKKVYMSLHGNWWQFDPALSLQKIGQNLNSENTA